MEGLDYWRLCDELSVTQAALLICGHDPGGEMAYVESWSTHERPLGYEAAKSALKHAILSGGLPAIVRRSAWERGWDEEPSEGEYFEKAVSIFASDVPVANLRAIDKAESVRARGVIYRAEPDWCLTTVYVENLRKWLKKRGFSSGFFFPEEDGKVGVEYLDKSHARYANKLAAAVNAWLAVEDPAGKHPKGALVKWLREHAAEYGLSDDEGKPNEQGIEECAKVANWQPGGGAPKTPGA